MTHTRGAPSTVRLVHQHGKGFAAKERLAARSIHLGYLKYRQAPRGCSPPPTTTPSCGGASEVPIVAQILEHAPQPSASCLVPGRSRRLGHPPVHEVLARASARVLARRQDELVVGPEATRAARSGTRTRHLSGHPHAREARHGLSTTPPRAGTPRAVVAIPGTTRLLRIGAV